MKEMLLQHKCPAAIGTGHFSSSSLLATTELPSAWRAGTSGTAGAARAVRSIGGPKAGEGHPESLGEGLQPVAGESSVQK